MGPLCCMGDFQILNSESKCQWQHRAKQLQPISSARAPVYRGWNSGSSSVSALVNAWGRTDFLTEDDLNVCNLHGESVRRENTCIHARVGTFWLHLASVMNIQPTVARAAGYLFGLFVSTVSPNPLVFVLSLVLNAIISHISWSCLPS